MSDRAQDFVADLLMDALTGGALYWPFLVPTTVIIIGFWAFWRLIGLTNLSGVERRRWFVLFGIVLFTPIPMFSIPGIGITIVPNAFFVLEKLTNDAPIPWVYKYLALSPLTAVSAVITSVPLVVIAWVFVGRSTIKDQWRWGDVALPVMVLVGTLAVAALTLPAYPIPRYAMTAALERVYGATLDDMEALVDVSDTGEGSSERARVEALLRADDAVIDADLYDLTSDSRSVFLVDVGYVSVFCVDDHQVAAARLSRCIWTDSRSTAMRRITYVRAPSDAYSTPVKAAIGFDYVKLQNRL